VRIFITGHKGQLGTALRQRLSDHELSCGDLPEWDITDAGQVGAAFREARPDVVIHAAALTNVDACAEHPDEAMRINGVGTYNVALACREVDATLVAISTNEVFDGAASAPYQEADRPNPVNPYGASKWVAEQMAAWVAPRYVIARTAWLYAPGGRNFIHRIIVRARAGELLRVVTDEIGSPTYVVDLADALARVIDAGLHGIVHLVNEGACSRHAFAEEILRLAGLGQLPIAPITLADFKRPSTVPPHTPLANVIAASAGIRLRRWQEALAAYVAEYEADDGAGAAA
jgi:dTDP-4-dehydrorhamnose reductase